MDDNIIFPAPHQIVQNLSEIAIQINAAHDCVQATIRDGLGHAKRAGDLLCQAKARVSHGNWGPWLQANFRGTPRTAQRYMTLAENWESIKGKDRGNLGLLGALKLIAREKVAPESSNTTRVSYLPPAVNYYFNLGLITNEVADQISSLVMDYGNEILSEIQFNDVPESICGDRSFFNLIRPLDCPPLWPFAARKGTPSTDVIKAAVSIFLKDGCLRGRIPQWEVTAFWFASAMVCFCDVAPDLKQQLAASFPHNLALWRCSFRTALFMVASTEYEFIQQMKDGEKLWLGYASDLRHAGVLRAAREMQNGSDHPALRTSMKAGLEEMIQNSSYALPTCMQGRLDRANS